MDKLGVSASKIRREKIARLKMLFNDFPAVYDAFKEMESVSAWEKLESVTNHEIKSNELGLIKTIESLGGKPEFLFNSTVSLLYDFFILKFSNTSPVETLKNNRVRYKKLPCRTLVEPKLKYSKNPNSIRKNLLYFALYAEIRTLLSIIDIGLAVDPTLLNSKGRFAKNIFENDELFLKGIKVDPIINSTFWAFIKTKFQMPLWKSENYEKYRKSLGAIPEEDADSLRAARRAIFFIAVFEPDCLDLTITDLHSILTQYEIISSDYQKGSLKKVKHNIQNHLLLVGK